MENPCKFNEQIRNEDTKFILGEDFQVFPFLSLISMVSPFSFFTISLRSEWVKGTESTLIATLGSTLHFTLKTVQRYQLVAYLTVVMP